MQSKFITELNRSYKSILTEQVPPTPAPLDANIGAPTPAPVTAVAPTPETPSPEAPATENTGTNPEARGSRDAFLIGLVAKALLINIDDDDKLKIVKFLETLNKDNMSEVEESLVNIVNSHGYQNLDIKLEDNFEIAPKKSRETIKFLNNILSDYQ